jgi:predicted MFS family arabinose efflux permease
VIAAIGEGLCFLLNAVSFIAVILALLAMKIPKKEKPSAKHGVLKGYKEGIRYVYTFAPIKYILIQLALVSFMGMPYAVLMPIFARDILHGGPHTLGFLMGAIGIGALAGAAFLASRKSAVGLGKWIPIASTMFGTGLAVFSFSTVQWISIGLLPFVGFGMMVQMASCNTMLQTIADDDKRGRVMSFYTLAFSGTMPFGSLFGGTIASKIGAPHTLLISGIVCIIGALFFVTKLPMIRKEIRPIYRKIGLIPNLPDSYEDPTPINPAPEAEID